MILDARETAKYTDLQLQQAQIKSLLLEPHLLLAENEHHANPGVNFVIPVHSQARFATLDIAFQSISDQIYPPSGKDAFIYPVNVIIANNGLSFEESQQVASMGRGKGLNTYVVDANPIIPQYQSPAYGRNQAINWLRDERFKDPKLDLDTIVFLDSDSALMPGSLSTLYDTFQESEQTVAVSAAVTPVAELTSDVYLRRTRQQPVVDTHARVLPKLLNARGFDMGGMVAYSSQIAGKTDGLLISSSVVLDRMDETFPLLKSGEDMTFSAGLSRHGEIVFDGKAVVLDQSRESEAQMFLQQMQWGRDHQILLHHLEQLGIVEPGIHVLTPVDDSRWEETILENTQGITGFVINPGEIMQVSRQLKSLAESGHQDLTEKLEELTLGICFIERLLELINKTPASEHISRSELPHPTRRNIKDDPRQLPVSKLGRLAGNIFGIIEIANLMGEDLTDNIPSRFVLGLRQAGTWE